MIEQHTAVAVIRPSDVEVKPLRGSRLTIDEAWSPAIQGTIECAVPADDDRAAIDPRDNIRMDLRVRRDFGRPFSFGDLTALGGGAMSVWTALLAGGRLSNLTNAVVQPWNGGVNIPAKRRSFNLVVSRRAIAESDSTMTLEVSSLEKLLWVDRLIGAPLDPGTLDRLVIVQWVLDRYDATLVDAPSVAPVAEADAVIWQPSTTAWEYVDTLLAPVSLRLWADDAGDFRLTERQSEVEGSVSFSPANLVDLRDEISIDNPEVYADAVNITYTWVDDDGLTHVDHDGVGAQPSLSPLQIDRKTRYPGTGAAAGILARQEGRGRLLELVAASDYELDPGMNVGITPLVGEASNGFISRLDFDMVAGDMTVKTRGLVDIPVDAYLYGDDVTCDDVAAGAHPDITCDTFDWSLI